MRKPWEGKFPLDDPREMDDEAVRILLANMLAGRADRSTREEDSRGSDPR
jgi:hypothetical protein